ncbi:hypothetical protein K502DRAFT_330934 [Neoconidiobolus thromboides FSU 785]|nr:hypothetical protein K502DRAFT_330934 [Neoconidiobolus thromboides FSU 785]
MILFYLFIISYYCQQILVPMYGGNCEIVDNNLYYLGGVKKWPDSGFNRIVYNLNLNSQFSINSVPWKFKNIDQLAPSIVYPNLFTKDSLIYVRGGLYTPGIESVKTFDISLNQWLTDEKNSQADIISNYYNSKDIQSNLKFTEYLSNLVQINANEAILLGGFIDSPTRNNSANKLITRWNTNLNTWNIDTLKSFPPIIDFASFVNNDNIISVGGQFYPNNEKVPMDTAYVYNFNQRQLNEVKLSGDIPKGRVGHQIVNLNQTHYIMLGGAFSTGRSNFTEVDDSYLLNIEEYKWYRLELENFKPSYKPCLVKYNDYLIYSLGYSSNFTNSTQLIHVNQLKLVNTYQPKGESNSLPWILGFSIGGVILLVIIGLITYYYYKKHKQKQLSKVKMGKISIITEPLFVNTYPMGSTNPDALAIVRNPSLSQNHLFKFNSLDTTFDHDLTFDHGNMIRK